MKNHYTIEDYFLSDYTIIVYFAINQELEFRKLDIDIDEFDEFLSNMGCYEQSEDCWDYSSESHYTKDWEIDFITYWEDYRDSDHIIEYIEHYLKNNDLPNIEEE